MSNEERPNELKQAERYGGPASDGRLSDASAGRRPASAGPSVASAYIGGVLMIGATLLSGALGAPSLLAFFIGLCVFAITVIVMLPKAQQGMLGATRGPISVDRAAAMAAGLDPERAEARLREADARLRRLEEIGASQRDRKLSEALRETAQAARETLRALGEDPGDIDRARKFLVVVIPSAVAAAEKFQALGVRDAALETRFAALIAEVKEAAQRQRAALRRDDAMALEVEMEVLAERLERE